MGCENPPMAMNPTAWLEARGSGYDALSQEERDAVAHFALLWSLFESVALGRSGSAAGLVRVATEWQDAGLLLEDSFGAALRHFQSRYYSNGAFTQHFAHLNLRPHDRPGLVVKAIRGEAVDVAQTTAAVLIIVYRFRNNLFHGEKWTYRLQGQLENMAHANDVLMEAIELHETMVRQMNRAVTQHTEP